jgi:hypothetical protein
LVGLRYIAVAAIVVGAATAIFIALVALLDRYEKSDRMNTVSRSTPTGTPAETQKVLGTSVPKLEMPARFTQFWIRRHVPELRRDQIPALLFELKRRGWSDEEIDQRVTPYLSAE